MSSIVLYCLLSILVVAGADVLIPNQFVNLNFKLTFTFSTLQATVPVNSSPPNAAYMRRWTGLSLVQVMACRLLGAKPLPEPMLIYCQLDSWEQISMKFESQFYHFHSRKFIWKCLPKWWPFCPGRDELNSPCLLQDCWWLLWNGWDILIFGYRIENCFGKHCMLCLYY